MNCSTNMSLETPSKYQLENLSEACEALWKLDANRLTHGKHFELNLQHGKGLWEEGDAARDPLFCKVDIQLLKSRPSVNAFVALLDNYTSTAGIAEVFTKQELTENYRFIDAIYNTDPIQYLHKYLVAKHLSPSDVPSFKRILFDIWFKPYKRVVQNDSSAFEHCFVGEVRKDKGIIGFHNWIKFFLEERAGRVDYRGYIYPKKRNHAQTESSHVINIQLSWYGDVKPISTFIIGCSPEFEIALYTLVFLTGVPNSEGTIIVPIVIDDVEVVLKVHTFQNHDGQKLGS
ncbi:hypothetical protein HK096_009687, partial [Nowakowskiella sp. JEL0078]